jgi:spoIIIJ-associated protein
VGHAEASARTVEAAVTVAAAQLGLRPDQVDIEVLEDPVPSTFGYIGTPARVRVTPRPTTDPTMASAGAASPAVGPAGIPEAPVITGLTNGSDTSDLTSGSVPSDLSSRPAVEPDRSEPPSDPALAPAAAGSGRADIPGRSGSDDPTAAEVPPTAAPPSLVGIADATSASDGTGAAVDSAPHDSATSPSSDPEREHDRIVGAAARAESSSAPEGESSRGTAAIQGSASEQGSPTPSDGALETRTAVIPATATIGVVPPVSSGPERSSASKPPRRAYRDEPIEPEMVEVDTERAGDFLEGLLDAMDVDGDITTWIDEVGGHIDLEGSDLDALVGSNGETLDALQELTRLAVLRQSKRRARLLLDINGFRARQREQLISIVQSTVEQVIRTREEHEFQPMTPAERKIVHDAVAAIDGASTESLGEEPNRRVVIRPT